MIVSVNYKRKSEPKSELAQFDTVKEAVGFVQSQAPDEIEYIGLTDGYGHQEVGVKAIVKTFEAQSDLWAGSAMCFHPVTGSGHGGGIVCKTCRAWFCY